MGAGIQAVAEVLTTNAASNACFSRAGLFGTISPVGPPSQAESLALLPGRITVLSDPGSWRCVSVVELRPSLIARLASRICDDPQ